ncbi:hypothetical protein JXA31_09365 [Candidatus Bathyarchaeota archaeon]|nr:hypothetical protein [Candidatus Bathyarchaeota archaeon]
MSLKRAFMNRIRGWLPKGYNFTLADKMSKPRWWKPLWAVTIVGIIVSTLFSFLIFHVPVERAILGLVLSLLCVSFAYYIRVRPSMKMNRGLYVLLGITPIGFSLWMVLALSGLGRWLTNMVGAFPSLIIGWVVCFSIGALIGDWIGKRRNYHLPLSP